MTKPERVRPRRCAVCHVDATHIEQELRPWVHIALDATVSRGQHLVGTYYCDDHTGMA